MKHILVAGALALALSGCASQQPEAPFTLTLAHINDTHSHFDPSDAALTLDGRQVYTRLGGFPRLLSYANTLREQAQLADQPLLFVHGGDAWQGTGYFKLNQGAMNADLLSRLGLDAMVPGQHEFDLDSARLAAFIEGVNFPVLAANLNARKDPALNAAGNLYPYVLYAFDGNDKERLESMEDADSDPVVAVIGLVPEDLSEQAANPGRLAFNHEVETAQRTVNALRAQGVKHIVALTHLGLERDQRLASRVNGIDLIVGGRSETLMGDFASLGLGKNPPYAQQVTNPDGRAKTCVVQAGHFAQAMGRVSVTFTPDGRVSRCEGGNTLLTDGVFYNDIRRGKQHRLSEAEQQRLNQAVAADARMAVVAEDAELRRHIDTQYRPALNAAYGEVIGHVPATLTHQGLPGQDGSASDLGPLVAASQLYWANTPEVRAVTGRRADIALVGASAIRTPLEPGALRQGNVTLELLPYSTPLSLVSLTGRQLAGLLLETINASLADNQAAGAFPYMAGLRYRFDETRKGAGFLRMIEVRQGRQWVKLDSNASYNVVINGYHASGNDGWNSLYQLQRVLTDRIDLARVKGRLTAFPVARLSQTRRGAIRVHYINQALRCRAGGVQCNTDAEAFMDYVRERRPLLTPLADSGITLNRL
ncbi:bifunctional metallophosphatase/5'-nucleotidase [Oceanimonas sp. CHS3-5]|uniref:bifunctional metallophosphatase/5'-nucleotidase n=1 Tax=Oceanimonas sp. CHS3-5 TaxID=3068186 RepID=UPI00274025EA|nr:bifunctional metallophosphatase/5'-nucleotidase [Oceanimonas sp. CHS3-5]MDP5291037.1 bifunctional metallophosphatase/5'-nucleotidase [Oceanimonas sp. CHS3-5]